VRQEVVVVVAVTEGHFFERARQDVSAERDGRMRKVRQLVTGFFFSLNCRITDKILTFCISSFQNSWYFAFCIL
jgi:hypothetical protein